MIQTPNLIRPLSISQIFDQAIALYRRHFWQLLGIIALVQIPLIIIQLIGSSLGVSSFQASLEFLLRDVPPTQPVQSTSALFGSALSGLSGIIGFVLIQGLALSAVTQTVAGHYTGRSQSGILAAYGRVKRGWLSVLGGQLLLAVLIILAAIWFFVPCLGWFTGLGLVYVLGRVIYPLIASVVLLEKCPSSLAWRRAWDLARTRFWPMLGLSFVLYLFSIFLSLGPAGLLSLLAQLILGSSLESFSLVFQVIFPALTTLAAGLLYYPLEATVFTLVYFDLRVRNEGIDLVAQANSHLGADEQWSLALESTPKLVSPTLLTTTETLYLVVPTIVMLAVVFVIWAGFLLLFLAIGGS